MLSENLDILGGTNPGEIAEGLDGVSSLFNVPHIVIVSPAKSPSMSPMFLGKDPLGQEPSDAMMERSSHNLIVSSILADFVTLKPETRDRVVKFLGWMLWVYFLTSRDGLTIRGQRIEGIIDELNSTRPAWTWWMKEVGKSKKSELTEQWRKDKERSRKVEQFCRNLVRKDNLFDLLSTLHNLTEEDWHSVYLAIGDMDEQLKALLWRPAGIFQDIVKDQWPETSRNLVPRIPLDILNSVLRFILLESGNERFRATSRKPSAEYTRDAVGEFHQIEFNPTDSFHVPKGWSPPESLNEIQGDLAYARGTLASLTNGLEDFQKLLTGRKIVVIHLWNFPQIEEERKKSTILKEFDDWMNSARNGGPGSLPEMLFRFVRPKDLSRALRKVRRGLEPGYVLATIESNIMGPDLNRKLQRTKSEVLNELYEYHPRGRDPEFWREMYELSKTVEERREAVVRKLLLSNMKREVEFWKDRVPIDTELLSYLVGRYAQFETDVQILKDHGSASAIGLTKNQFATFLRIEQNFRSQSQKTGNWPHPDISFEKQEIATRAHLDGKWTPWLP